jgi:putative redox protein
MKIEVKWQGGDPADPENLNFLGFSEDGYEILMGPSNKDHKPKNVSPKALLLYGLAGCAMIDIVMILNKSRKKIDNFRVIAESELVGNFPKVFKYVLLNFHIAGKNLDESTVKRAIDLSLEKYCGVSKMLEKSMTIDYRVFINSNSDN